MNTTILVSVIVSFAVSVLLGPVIIPFLRKLKVGQTIRDEGPQSHLKKNGTPTMGGILILLSVVVTSLLFVKDYPKIIPILFLTLGFGLVGFLDDYIKVVLKRSMGLRAWQKMALQIVVTGVFAYYLLHYTDVSLAMKVPFMDGVYLDFGWMNIPILFVVVIGTVNGTNFTDGLDGLASSVTVLVATFFTVVAIGTGSGYVCCGGRAAWLSAVQRSSGECFHGRYRIARAGRLCGGLRIYDADAAVYRDRRIYLSGRGAVRYPAGFLF